MRKILALVVMAASFNSAIAATRYEQTKAMFEKAVAPKSESELITKILQIKDCADFGLEYPDSTRPQTLKVVSHTIRGAGPEFPDKTLKGIGFAGSDRDTEKFFQSYISNLSAAGFSIGYDYKYYKSGKCYGNITDGYECEDDTWETVTDSGTLRVSQKYIHFMRGENRYGYCWY